jgi:exonuclease VII large subunit
MEYRLERTGLELAGKIERLGKWWVDAKTESMALLNGISSDSTGSTCGLLGRRRDVCTNLSNRLSMASPSLRIKAGFTDIRHRLHVVEIALENRLSTVKKVMSERIRTLKGLGPMEVLGRGYAICTTGDGTSVITCVNDISRGDSMIVNFRDGGALCRVEEERKEKAWLPKRISKTR